MENLKSIKRGWALFFALLILYFAFFGLIYWIAGEQMESIKSQTDTVEPVYSDGGLVGNTVLEQRFTIRTDTLDQILLFTRTFDRENTSKLTFQIFDGSELLWEQFFSTAGLKDFSYNAFMLDKPLTKTKDKTLLLRISAVNVPVEQAVSFYFGDKISTGKADIEINVDYPLYINGQPMPGTLCMSLIGRELLAVKAIYWPVVLFVALMLSALFWAACVKYRRSGSGPVKTVLAIKKYFFLMKQLVLRDFKTKYKRSVLGVLWSFLNPLLTMSVQYLIFGSLFQSSIENFAIYLMTGIVIYNFFAESVGLGLTSIVANASLITKVYVPKYIYPISRVLSSSINVLMSLIPLCIMILISGIPLQKSMLLFPLVLVYTMVFCIGISLFLASAMVYFRDTQFLWGIVSMLWMYLTPIFYPESIIPQSLLSLYHLNPLYQFIFFLREITLNGVAPGPYTFLYCTLASVIPFAIGTLVFKKTQDRFVFYL